ncbi:MAG: hypothetical protein E7457_03465 [Ruminococcaceae bacterium]|nr:hypothetical protein [Oscillospiraceae bacterium]
MVCPYCQKEMQAGSIGSTRPLQWCAADGPLPRKAVRLTDSAVFGGETEAWYCEVCRKMILPVPERKSAMEKLKKTFAGKEAPREE